jgi:IS5 family transposase
MASHKKAGLRIKDMVKSNWVYRKLRNFRAGIESDISCLQRAYGLALHLARARPLQGLRLVLSRRLQPRPLRPAQADLTLAFGGAPESPA